MTEITAFGSRMPARLLQAAQEALEEEFGPLGWRAAGSNYGAPRRFVVSRFSDGPIPYGDDISEDRLKGVFSALSAAQELESMRVELTPTGAYRMTAVAGSAWQLVMEVRTFAFIGVRPAVADDV